jgi:hypothetical protein
MTVDEALRESDRNVLGRIVIDPAFARAHCKGEPGMAGVAHKQRREGAKSFARCLSHGDWSTARRLGLDYGAGIGKPPKSCGFGKHEVAHLFYGMDELLVRVSVRAFTDGGRHAIILPVRCTLPFSYDADGNKELIPVAEWVKRHPTDEAPCPGLPWPVAWDLPKPCPVP